MKVLAGDNIGIIKLVDVTNKKVECKFGEQTSNNDVIKICKVEESKQSLSSSILSNDFAVFKKKDFTIINTVNQLTVFNLSLNKFNNEKDDSCDPNSFLKYDISKFYNNSNNSDYFIPGIIKNSKIYLSNSLGNIRSISFKERSDQDEEYILSNDNFNVLENPKISKLEKLVDLKNGNNQDRFACLYNNSPFKIFDLNKECFSFKSKNVPNDELDLRVDIWDTDLVEIEGKNDVFYVSTGYGKVSIFNLRSEHMILELNHNQLLIKQNLTKFL